MCIRFLLWLKEEAAADELAEVLMLAVVVVAVLQWASLMWFLGNHCRRLLSAPLELPV